MILAKTVYLVRKKTRTKSVEADAGSRAQYEGTP